MSPVIRRRLEEIFGLCLALQQRTDLHVFFDIHGHVGVVAVLVRPASTDYSANAEGTRTDLFKDEASFGLDHASYDFLTPDQRNDRCLSELTRLRDALSDFADHAEVSA
ncbi:hypothetical protein [Stutzerimonas nitrititolerans]|uniref:hypothetical protein n=1 Tax=Stutzerimonas nitrititolerans TaxID=2482751 RepID=UPI0028AA8BDB|nr:hypothetical protein [Stutzerimonas nitrititolerans]